MTTDFKTLLERATRKIAYKKYNTVQNHNFNAFEKGAELPNELLLKALEALDIIAEAANKSSVGFLSTRTLNEIRSRLESEAK